MSRKSKPKIRTVSDKTHRKRRDGRIEVRHNMIEKYHKKNKDGWVCPSCDISNKTKWVTCGRCGKPKPSEVTV